MWFENALVGCWAGVVCLPRWVVSKSVHDSLIFEKDLKLKLLRSRNDLGRKQIFLMDWKCRFINLCRPIFLSFVEAQNTPNR